jgi:hypothetical protein
MNPSNFIRQFRRAVAALLIVTFSSATLAQEATIRVTRKATDQYAVSKTDVVITTKYCHEYARDEEAVLMTRQDGAENALLFASGAQCEVVAAVKPTDSKFNLLDFLIQLGLMIATKGVLGSVSNPIPMPKR